MIFFMIQSILITLAILFIIACVISFLVFLWTDGNETAGKLAVSFMLLALMLGVIGFCHCVIG